MNAHFVSPSDHLPARSFYWKTNGQIVINPLTPNDPYNRRTAPLTCKVAFYIFIQQI